MLDKNLGIELDLIKFLNIRSAAITNWSVFWMNKVKKYLAKADWVSLKINSVLDDVWYRINRPHGSLILKKVLDCMIIFL